MLVAVIVTYRSSRRITAVPDFLPSLLQETGWQLDLDHETRCEVGVSIPALPTIEAFRKMQECA
jgi:hypothetical protein